MNSNDLKSITFFSVLSGFKFKSRLKVEDIIFLVRKHPRMYARVRELLTMNEELKKARKAFDEVKYVQGSK